MKPTLYDGCVISVKHDAMHVIDDEETLILEEESLSKMSEKAKDPETIKQNISHKLINYEKLIRLTEDFRKRFTPQQELSAEQAFWLHISNPSIESSSSPPVRVDKYPHWLFYFIYLSHKLISYTHTFIRAFGEEEGVVRILRSNDPKTLLIRHHFTTILPPQTTTIAMNF
ncbi:hypothetical protein Tco_0174772 [Tanacetum coccineum]